MWQPVRRQSLHFQHVPRSSGIRCRGALFGHGMLDPHIRAPLQSCCRITWRPHLVCSQFRSRVLITIRAPFQPQIWRYILLCKLNWRLSSASLTTMKPCRFQGRSNTRRLTIDLGGQDCLHSQNHCIPVGLEFCLHHQVIAPDPGSLLGSIQHTCVTPQPALSCDVRGVGQA